MFLFFIIRLTIQIDESQFNNADSDSNNEVFCDSKNQIRTIHSNSIQPIQSDGYKCYQYTPNSNSNQYIKSFPASYFGLETFADAVPNDTLPASVRLETSQSQIPESMTIFFDNSTQIYSALLLPIPIGSNFANAYVPFKDGKEYSTRLCIIKNLSEISTENNKYEAYPSPQANLTIKNSTIHYIVSVGEPSSMPTQDLPLPSLEDLYLVEPEITTQNPTLNNGYVFGYPVQKQNGAGPILINGRIPLIFGQNSNVFFEFSGDENSTLNLENITVKRKPNDPSEPTYENISTTSQSDHYVVYWSILYQKIGTSSDYSYEITHVKTEIQTPETASVPNMASISIKFYELSQDGNSLYEYPEDELFSYSLSLAFDAFFVRATDSIRTSGIFFLFGLFGTLWAYYSFQFTD